MGRKNGRPNVHIQEKRSAAGLPLPSSTTSTEDTAEPQQPGWRWAVTLWAIVFLFLSALMVFDLIVSVVRG